MVLASLEKISEKNIEMYLSMMTDGLSELILVSKPGALYISKMISIGCEGGLRIKQGKTLKDTCVEHKTASGITFKEKLALNFANYFKNYTDANIF